MSLNKNDKEARDINLEHAKWLDNSSNQIQEVETQDGSKEENNSKKTSISVPSKAFKIIAGGVILVVGIGIGSMMTKKSENGPVYSGSSISNSMSSEDCITTDANGMEDASSSMVSDEDDLITLHSFPETLNYATPRIDFSTFSEFDQVVLPDYDYAELDYLYATFYYQDLFYRDPPFAVNEAFLLREVAPSQYSISYINMNEYLTNPTAVNNWLDTNMTSMYDDNHQKIVTPMDLSNIEEETTILIPFPSVIGDPSEVLKISKIDNGRSMALCYDFSLENVNNTIMNVLAERGIDASIIPLSFDSSKVLRR